MSLTIRMSDWTSFTPTTTISWLDTLASPRRFRTSVVSSIGPQMVAFVTDYIHSCSVCSRSKSLHHKPFGPHQFLPIGERPWDSISMDFIEGLPLLDRRDMILVVVCHLTKMALFILPSGILMLKT